LKLDVHVQGRRVATLFRERGDCVLQYEPNTAPSDFVSLTMPVREAPWRWPRELHPFFRQNLPEGPLLNLIREQCGRPLDGSDLALLAMVGAMGIGRVTVTPQGVAPGTELRPLDIGTLLHGDNHAERFAALARDYACAAVSGAAPKFIAPSWIRNGGAQYTLPLDGALPGKATLRTSRYIVKGSDDETPYLGFNEFYSMRVLERLGVARVARTQMSDDGRALLVERFDVDEHGFAVCGVEDACSLLGLPPHEKYNASAEQVLHAARAYLLDRDTLREQMRQFGWQLLLNYVVRNAGCHAKNIALVYTNVEDVRFAPVYGVATTQAYARGGAGVPALAIDGCRSWVPGRSLERFFNARLGIAPRAYAQMVEALCDSAVSVGHQVIAAAHDEPRWYGIARRMLQAWDEGIASLRCAKRAVAVQGLAPLLETAGVGAAQPALRAPDTIPLAPQSHKH
jgi:serine/threonine-protein kinase HipA